MNNPSAFNKQILNHLQQEITPGDQRAFRQLFDQYAEKLSRFAFSIVKNKEAAIEVVDEIFVKSWKQRVNVPSIEYFDFFPQMAIKKNKIFSFSLRSTS